MAQQHGLFRSRTDKVFGGVCAGIAKSLNTDTFLIRLVFVLLFIFAGSGLLLYLILWIALPEEPLPMYEDFNPASGEQQSPEPGQQAATPDTPVFVPRKNNGALIVGIIFIGIGIIFLADRFIPRIHFSDLWPILIVIAGIVLIASSFLNNKRA